MARTLAARALVPAMLILLLSACEGGGGNPSPNPQNQPPVAVIEGPVKAAVFAGSSVLLDAARASDADGSIRSVRWEQSAGPDVEIADPAAQVLEFIAPPVTEDTEIVFVLAVTDDDGATSTAEIRLIIHALVAGNASPSAVTSTDLIVRAGDEVQLDARSSSDMDGTVAAYAWTQIAGAPVVLAEAASSTATFTASAVGSFTFRVVVADDDGATDSDVINVQVLAANANQPPQASIVALANPVPEGTGFTLDGGASSDAENEDLEFRWTAPAGFTVQDESLTESRLLVTGTPDVASDASYMFLLVVNDGQFTATTAAPVTVAAFNRAPQVKVETTPAAIEQNGLPEGASAMLKAVASDPDNHAIARFEWEQLAGDEAVNLEDVTGDTLAFQAPDVGAEGDRYEFRVTVEDAEGASASATLAFDVTFVNRVPIAQLTASANEAAEGTSVRLSALGSSDPDGQTLSYEWEQIDLLNGMPTASVFNNGDGTVDVVMPEISAAQDGGLLRLRVTANDGAGGKTFAETDIAVRFLNQPPQLRSITASRNSVPEGELAPNVTLTVDAFDPDGAALTYNWEVPGGFVATGRGTATLTLTRTPDVAARSTVPFRVQVTDAQGAAETFGIPLTVEFVNVRPVVDAGSLVQIPEDADLETLEFRLDGSASRDADAEKGHQSLALTWGVPEGSGLVLDDINAVSPRIAAVPEVSTETDIPVTLEASDGVETVTGSTTVKVLYVNRPPAVDSIAGDSEVQEGSAFALTASASDDGEVAGYEWTVPIGFTVDPASRTAQTLEILGTPDVTFADSETGIVGRFSVVAIDDDGARSASREHPVTVSFLNQVPVISNISGSGNVNEQTLNHTLTATGADGDGHDLEFHWTRTDESEISDDALGVTLPFTGQSLTFNAPDVSVDTPITFSVTATDGFANSEATEFTVTILKDGGAPVIDAITPSAASLPEGVGHTFTLTATASDNLDAAEDLVYDWTPASDFVTRVDAAQPQVLIIETTPDVGVAGGDFAFELRVTDSDGHSVTRTTNVHVDFVNVSPVIESVNVPMSVAEGSEATLSVNASDADGQTLTYLWQRTPEVGDLVTNADGTATFTAPEVGPDDNVTVTFSVTVNDQSGADNASVTEAGPVVAIDFLNEQPQISAAGSNIADDTVELTVTATDPDGQPLEYAWLQDPTDGTQVDLIPGADGGATFAKPDVDAELHFTVTASDGELEAIANVTVTLAAENRPPVIEGIVQTASEVDEGNVDVAFTVTATDDAAGTLTYAWTVPGDFEGRVAGADTNELRIASTPDVTADTPYEFSVRVSDGELETPSDVVPLLVRFVNQQPVIDLVASNSPVNEGSEVRLTINAHDDDAGQILAYRWTQRAGEMPEITDIAVDPATGLATFTAPVIAAGGSLDLHFTVTVDDQSGAGNATRASEELTVTINRVNDAPVITGFTQSNTSVPEGALVDSVTFTVTAEDDGGVDALTYQWNIPDGFTTTEDGPTLTVTGTPGVSATRNFPFTVTVRDDEGGFVTSAALDLEVRFVNQPPTVSITSDPADLADVAVNESSGTIVLTANGTDPDGNGDPTYSWLQTDASETRLGIDGSGGSELSFAVPSVNADTTFTVQVTATDVDAPDVTETASITFTVIDLGDVPAVRIEPNPAGLAGDGVLSGFPVTLETSIENLDEPVTYLWSQTAGLAEADLEVDGQTGPAVSFVAPDVAGPTSVTVQVTATSGGNTANALISFMVDRRPAGMPLPFTFVDLARVPAHELTVTPRFASAPVTVNGLGTSAPISISAGGEYAVNGSTAFRTTSSTVNNGDTVVVRVTGSTAVGVERSATLTVGGVSDTFTATTVDPNFAVDVKFGEVNLGWDSLQGLDNTQLYYSEPNLTSDFATFSFLQSFLDTPVEFTHAVSEYVWAINWATGGYKLRGDNLHSDVFQLKNGFPQFSAEASRDAIGYFKSAEPEIGGEHGGSVALWTLKQLPPDTPADRSVLVVGAPRESVGTDEHQGRAYIYRRDAELAGEWQLDQTLGGVHNDGMFGDSVALSGDGNVLVIAAPMAQVGETTGAGEVYVYRFDGNAYVSEGSIRSPRFDHTGERFGTAVAISSDGTLLAVGVPNDMSGDPGNVDDTTAPDAGAVYLFRYTGAGWNQEAHIKEATPVAGNRFGTAVAIGFGTEAGAERDERLFVSRLGATRSVFVYEPEAAGTWNPVAQLDQPAGAAANFGEQLSATRTRTPGFDADIPTFVTGTHAYERSTTGTWNATNLLSLIPAAARGGTPASIAITEGSTPTAVTIAFKDTVKAGSGIYLPANVPTTTAESGSVYVFSKFFAWQFKRLLKAPNAEDGDRFGECMAIDFNARRIAVCAPGEDSAGVGVHPVEPIDTREDNTVEDAGAVYIY